MNVIHNGIKGTVVFISLWYSVQCVHQLDVGVSSSCMLMVGRLTSSSGWWDAGKVVTYVMAGG